MEIKELRIGNLIKLHEIITKLEYTEFSFNPLFITPIPLTEEWLLKLGFDKLREYNDGENIIIEYGKSIIVGDNSHNEKLVIIFPFNHCEIGNYRSEDAYILNTTIDYVHQLQNLYFSLTGQEL
jgi:hypothetical protein